MLGSHPLWLGCFFATAWQTQARTASNLPFFTEAALIAAWELWKIRNDKVFQRHDPSPTVWIANFKNQCFLQSLRFKDDLRSTFVYGLMHLVNPCM
jgi:hypothetical protein